MNKHINLETAGFNCFCRAIAEELMGERPSADKLSVIFLPRMARYVIRLGIWRSLYQKWFGPPGTFSYVVSRTLAIDRIYEMALKKGIDQIVILGAGFDTRAFRIRGSRVASVFELDLDETQKLKRRKLERSRIPIPANLHFVPTDFRKITLEQCLSENGFDNAKKTLFIMEGLTMYLKRADVVETLRFIEKNSAPGSEAVFDVLHKSLIKGSTEGYGAAEMVDLLEKHQSPFHFAADPDQVREMVDSLGLNLLRVLSGEDMVRILTETSERLRDSVADYLTLYHVEVGR